MSSLTEEEQQYVVKRPKLDLFGEVLPSINKKTGNIIDEDPLKEGQYAPFIINKAFSFGVDTILYANEMNILHHLDKKLNYDFYYYALDKRPRYNKWVKQKDINNLDIVRDYYECSPRKARQYLKILTQQDITYIKKHVFRSENIRD